MPIRFTFSFAGTALATLALLLVQLHFDSRTLAAAAAVSAAV